MTLHSNLTRRRLNVVYDVAYPFVEGGGQKRIFEVAKRLAARGWSIRWYAFQTWDGAPIVEAHGITYVGLTGFVPLYTPDGRRSRREALAFGRAVWRHRRLIRNADVLWCGQWPYFHLPPLLVGTRTRLFVDWWETWHGHWFDYFGQITGFAGFICERLMAMICSRRGTIVAITPIGTRDVIRAWANPGSVVMIPCGIDFSKINETPPSKNQADIVYVGRLKNHKNVDHIIRAIHLLRVKYGLILHADIVGGGPEEQALRALSTELGVDSQIRFLGVLDDEQKYAHIKSAALFVHPSTKEGGGSISLFEAQACGTPVLIYAVPHGIDPSYVSEGVTGWRIDQVGPAALAARIAELVTADELKHRSREYDCRAAVLSYDWEQIAESYHKLFSGLPIL